MGRLWLSHHHDDGLDRCVMVGNVAVCRRCAVLYPVALATVLLAAAGLRWPEWLDQRLLWLLPIPAVVDFFADALGGRHAPRRQALATVPLAVAMGVAWLRLQSPFGDGLVWSVVGTYGAVCLLALWTGVRGRVGGPAVVEATPVAAEPGASTLGSDDRLRRDRRDVRRGAHLGR